MLEAALESGKPLAPTIPIFERLARYRAHGRRQSLEGGRQAGTETGATGSTGRQATRRRDDDGSENGLLEEENRVFSRMREVFSLETLEVIGTGILLLSPNALKPLR